MAKDRRGQKKKPYLKAIILGIISIFSYVALFSNQEIVTNISTKGGVYSALPILAVFYFSLIHGAFASNILSMLGIEAAKKKK